MIIQNDIKEKKTVRFCELDGGDIFSYDYPPTDVLIKLSTYEVIVDEKESRVGAIHLENGTYDDYIYDDSHLVYPLTGKLVITG